MKRKVFLIDDGEEWWISAFSKGQALSILAVDTARYKDVESFCKDHDVIVTACEEGELLTVKDYDNPTNPPVVKTAGLWAEEVEGIIGSTAYA
jgi:hypothetical protein